MIRIVDSHVIASKVPGASIVCGSAVALMSN